MKNNELLNKKKAHRVVVNTENRYDVKILKTFSAGMFTFKYLYHNTDTFEDALGNKAHRPAAYRRTREIVRAGYLDELLHPKGRRSVVYRLTEKGKVFLMDDCDMKDNEIRNVKVDISHAIHEMYVSSAWRMIKIAFDKTLAGDIQYKLIDELYLKQELMDSRNTKGMKFPDIRISVSRPSDTEGEHIRNNFNMEIHNSSNRNKLIKKLKTYTQTTLVVFVNSVHMINIQRRVSRIKNEIECDVLFASHNDLINPGKGFFADIWVDYGNNKIRISDYV